jgi:hypothetical protein
VIVKVQISQNDDGNTVLVYNKDRSFTQIFETDPDIRKLLGNRPKKYFKAELKGNDMEIHEQVPDQDW